MGLRENRTRDRKRALIPAFISDAEDSFDIACLIREMSQTGCRLVGAQIADLPEVVHVVPEGFQAPILGRIVWRQDKTAGISFEADAPDDDILLLGEPNLLGPPPGCTGPAATPLGYDSRLERMQARLNGRPLRRRQPG